jgi:rod shape determining protein RodA
MDIAVGRLGAERRPIRHLDPVLLLATFALTAIGLFMVYSSTHTSLHAFGIDPSYYVKKQIVWLMLSAIVLIVAMTFDYRLAKVYAGFAYGATIVLLILVRTPLGTTVKGAQRSFQVSGFALSPSEWMKVALIVMLAAFLSEIKSSDLSLQYVIRASALAALPMLLVFLQPDVGTTIVLATVLVGIVIVAGAKPRHLLTLGVLAIALLASAFQLGVVKTYQIDRVTGFLDDETKTSAQYNKHQAEIAIGAGGLTGVGWLKGTQTNLDYVPEQHTDFIFTAVGEEFGFVGSVGLLVIFAILLWRAFRIALLSKDAFGTYLAAGIAAMFAIQMFVNIGMTLGIMPITGIPLPFVSYGGSSLLANFAAVGLLMNIHMRRLK